MVQSSSLLCCGTISCSYFKGVGIAAPGALLSYYTSSEQHIIQMNSPAAAVSPIWVYEIVMRSSISNVKTRLSCLLASCDAPEIKLETELSIMNFGGTRILLVDANARDKLFVQRLGNGSLKPPSIKYDKYTKSSQVVLTYRDWICSGIITTGHKIVLSGSVCLYNPPPGLLDGDDAGPIQKSIWLTLKATRSAAWLTPIMWMCGLGIGCERTTSEYHLLFDAGCYNLFYPYDGDHSGNKTVCPVLWFDGLFDVNLYSVDFIKLNMMMTFRGEYMLNHLGEDCIGDNFISHSQSASSGKTSWFFFQTYNTLSIYRSLGVFISLPSFAIEVEF